MSKKYIVQEKNLQKRVGTAVSVLLVLTILFCFYVAIQVLSRGYVNLFGYSVFRVVTGSMEPTIPTGALLLMKHVDMEIIEAGDIICFKAQESAIFGKMMTHRVIEILPTVNGGVMFETRGDANIASDGYLVTTTNFVGKVIWFTGENSVLATGFSIITNKLGFLSCIVIPCLILSILVMRDCVSKMHLELEQVLREMEKEPVRKDPILDMTEEERDAMYQRIRAELMEELLHDATNPESTIE
ncbi:MAG: signal peptidase I [Firmicutes bacterium]|nr:signal peptidase I [Bacillota bacterium]MBQ6948768.1 signal peptidase I [Bacillota bacterium]